jgi:hypothetical protein
MVKCRCLLSALLTACARAWVCIIVHRHPIRQHMLTYDNSYRTPQAQTLLRVITPAHLR